MKLDFELCKRVGKDLPDDPAKDTPEQKDLRALILWAAMTSQSAGLLLTQLNAVAAGLGEISDPVDPNQI